MAKKVVLFLLLATISFAQESSIYPGAKSVLFTFGGLSNIVAGNYDGGAGFKYFPNSNMGLRFGVSFSHDGQTIPANPDPGENGIDGSASTTAFGVSAALEYHLTANRISPYVGGGVGFGMRSTEEKDAVSGTGLLFQNTLKNKLGTNSGTSFSVFALFGAEYFVTKEISFGAEYRLGYTILSESDQEFSSSNPNIKSVTTPGGSENTLKLESTGALTLAIYF